MKLTYNDRQHAYWLDGKRCRGATTVAKIPDDTYSLDQWRKRQVAIGMSLSPLLVERAAAHYDDKEILNEIAEEAMTAAKSHEAADRGTAAHRITERIDLAELVIDTPLAQAVRAAWTRALEDADLEIVPEYIERIVVYPDLRIAGRFDRIARRRSTGELVMLDLKTGAGAIRYPHAIACQLAIYVNAPLLAGPIPNDGGSIEQFEPMPELDLERAYVVHMPSDDEVSVVPIDIAAGWWAVEHICFPTLEWRARRDLVIDVEREYGDAPAGLVAELGKQTAPSLTSTFTSEQSPESPVSVSESAPGTGGRATRREALSGRIARLKADYPQALPALTRAWPKGVGTFKQQPVHTATDLDLIDAALWAVEREHGVPFPLDDAESEGRRAVRFGGVDIELGAA